MNTVNNSQSANTADTKSLIGREIMSVLNSCTIDLSIEQTLQELQISVERLTFGSESIGFDMSVSDMEGLLNGDVSPQTMTFLKWLHHRKILRIMIASNGRHMLTYCNEYYRKVQQVRISTAIPLRESFRIKLLTQLRLNYPEPARIVFETAPSLIAGCIIDDGKKRMDGTLLNRSPNHIHEYLDQHASGRKDPNAR